MGAQSTCHMRNSCQGTHDDWKEHCLDPKGLGAKASESGVHDAQQSQPF
jgi:hypothetical protein